MSVLWVARLELLIARRNMWVATSVLLMALFTVVLTLAGAAPAGVTGVDPLTVAITSITTLSVYLIPLIGLLLSYDAIAGEAERGTLALSLSYPLSRGEILLGKFLAHFCVLAFAVAVGLALTGALVVWRHGAGGLDFAPLFRLFGTSLALGAAFLGVGYLVSALVRQPGAASGVVIAVWLVSVVLYDLGLLGALVADGGGTFTRSVFPWVLVANPADAFRLLNMAEISSPVLTTGLSAAGSVSGLAGQLTSLLVWPVVTLVLAWSVFRKVEP
ncbi:Nitrous oxide reductase maturation transmembrane protein NosY [hydrothermal vent metagenome]|uniref:Nitrous oxide reductase maturation transmembrane protein NosY n=1 Tax=hydrothermal vent metagenome TaxID=652676 RepID=A0A3B0T8D2_9ZZZZ